MRFIRAIAAAAALAGLLVGVPWFLLAVGNAGDLITVDWRTALLVALDSRTVLALLSGIGWLAWSVVAVTAVAEIVAVVSRQRIRIHLPGTGWLRPGIAALVAAAAAAPTVAAADPGPVVHHVVSGAAAAGVAAPGQAPDRAPDAARRYLVQPGDELWTVAERELGAGERWRDIVALNDGLSEASALSPGATLLLPAPAVDAVVTVEAGDTLWSIAERELGDGERWPEIHSANRDRVDDPDVIDVGWRLVVPGADAPVAGSDVATDVPPDMSAPSQPDLGAAEVPQPGDDAARPDVQGQDPTASGPAPAAPGTTVTIEGQPGAANTAGTDGGSAPLSADQDASDALLGSLGALTAAGILAGLATRRRLQVLGRAVGRRIIPGSEELTRFWTALAGRAHGAAALPTDPAATTLVLGWRPGGEPVLLDLEKERATVVTGPESEAAIAAAITGLVCGTWAEAVRVTIVGGHDWADSLDDPRVTAIGTVDEGLAMLARTCSERRLAMGQGSVQTLRADPDTATAFEPTVVVFPTPISAVQFDALGDALALGDVGVSVLVAAAATPHIRAAVVDVAAAEGRWDGLAFAPQLLQRPAKRALLGLFHLTGTTETQPAPWWPEHTGNITPLPLHSAPEESPDMPAPPPAPDHPTLLLLGDVALEGAAGPKPSRAVGQCLEYCAWLLEHPGSTPSAMTRSLLVAEPTRRSNMSRLRGWLGTDADGANYLPDAYSGRVALDERVTSDWERFRAVLGGGVPLASDHALAEALGMVRGEPLGSFAFQWVWAHQVRADMAAMIVDAACVLADRALERADVDLALWAVGRGRLAAPDDDELAAREILAHARAGRWAEADRATLRLTRAARAAGRDLAPALARRIQLALHSAPARRAAPAAD